jgi:hypothetical protein
MLSRARRIAATLALRTWAILVALGSHDPELPANQQSLTFRPHVEHTELEEELHTRAHIDYDRVAIVSLACLKGTTSSND